MKVKIFSFVFFALLMTGFALADVSYYEENLSDYINIESTHVVLTKLRYESYPVSPGDYFTLYVQARKTGTYATDVEFELLPEYPFSLDSNEDPIRTYSSLNNEPVVLEYKVRVSEDAVSGLNTLKIKQTGSTGAVIINELDINVEDVQTSFDAVLQDSSDGEVSIAIANIGLNDADAAIVRVPDQEGVVVSGTNGQMIGNLEQGDYTVVGFDVSGMYSVLQLQIDYTDYIGVRRSEILEIPVSGSVSAAGEEVSGDMPEWGNGSPGEFGSRGEMNGSSSFGWIIWIVVVLVLALAVYLFFRFRKKGKGKKSFSAIPEWVKKEKATKK